MKRVTVSGLSTTEVMITELKMKGVTIQVIRVIDFDLLIIRVLISSYFNLLILI